jgi:tRNA-specific 2-thiouridylase
MRIAVAYSGGVDSTFAARLMQEQGHDVFALNMRLCQTDAPILKDTARSQARTKSVKYHQECTLCTDPCPCADASAGAESLGIPLHIIDLREEFRRTIIEPFCEAYLAGRTPNPCGFCNPAIKQGILAQAARDRGAEQMVTGHYARLVFDGEGRPHLGKARYTEKDQSYFLALCQPEGLRFVRFPLGEWDKQTVKQEVRRLGLVEAPPQESQDICFLHYTSHGDFITSLYPDRVIPGDIVDTEGKVLGQHKGLVYYTIGQRRGLGVAAGKPLFVIRLDAGRNQVVLGPEEAVYSTELRVERISYPSGIPGLKAGDTLGVKIRSRSPDREVTITEISGGNVAARFTEPALAVTPGQIAAFYRGEELIAGGVIP